jgi:pimeloyl-ACP methyl ester carboxylesterase
VRPQVICLPGGVAPAAQRYAPLKAAVRDTADLHLKDLEVYRDKVPPIDISIDDELGAVDRFADSLGLDRFHLVGYSGGGFISLAYAGKRSERLLSLALFEPAMVPGHATLPEQTAIGATKAKLNGLTGNDFMSAFVSAQVKPGVQVSAPSGPFPPEMQNRPAGIASMMRAFPAFGFDRESLRVGRFPVYLGYGDQTHEFEEIKAGILAQLFADIHVQRFSGIHHFVAPEQIYTPAHAASLLDLWRRAKESLGPVPSLQR